MKKTLMLLLLVCHVNILCAQSDLYIPPFTPVRPIERTHFQKAVGLSTDITVIALPVATLAGVLIAQDWEGLKQASLTAATSVGTMLLLKYTVHEMRPDMTNNHSFPSGHSTVAFASAAFLQRRYGWKFGAPAYALAAYTAVGRVLAKRHHWWDVVVGAAIGAGSAYIFTTPWAQKHEFAIVPAADDEHIGFAASLTF